MSAGKTTMAIVTLANYEWFKQWESERCTKRSVDYEGVKNTIGDRLVAQATRLFPQIKVSRRGVPSLADLVWYVLSVWI